MKPSMRFNSVVQELDAMASYSGLTGLKIQAIERRTARFKADLYLGKMQRRVLMADEVYFHEANISFAR